MESGEVLDGVGPKADLLLQLSNRCRFRGFSIDVSPAGGNFEQFGVQSRPILSDEHDRIVLDSDNRNCAGVMHDVAGDSLTIGGFELPARQRDHEPLMQGVLTDERETGGRDRARLRHDSADVRSSSNDGSCGLRPAARSSAARTNSRNKGAGRSGRLLNSGWACVAIQNGWSFNSMNSTSRPSGDSPDAARGRFPRDRVRYSG